MLSLTVLTCVVSAALGLTITPDGHYDTKYNHLDIEKILNNKRLVNYYAMCLIGKGPCTPQGTEFKRILPEALRTNCARCTEKQSITAYRAIRRLKKEFPKVWAELQNEWDPKGEYVSTFINTVETRYKITNTGEVNTFVNKIEVIPKTTTTTIPFTTPLILTTTDIDNLVIGNRFGEAIENEINSPATAPSNIKPLLLINSQTSTEKSSATVQPEIALSIKPLIYDDDKTIAPESSTIIYVNNAPYSRPTTQRPIIYTEKTTTPVNYRIGQRPNRFQIYLPRPELGLRLTANFIGQIGDIGSKVIKTGARIADMVLSSVQATLG